MSAFAQQFPPPPDWLGSEAAAVWRRIVPRLVARGIWEPAFESTCGAMCFAWVLYCRVARAGLAEAAACRRIAREWAAEFLLISPGRGHLAEIDDDGLDAELRRIFEG